MNFKLKCIIAGLFSLISVNMIFGQEIHVSENLVLYKLSEHCYEHTQNGNNGLVFINNGKAVIVSTPDSDLETQNLIDWVRNEQQAKIVAYVIDRWHPDAIQGLDVVQKNGIKSYAYELTRQIAKDKGLPIPKIGFNPKKEIKIGDEKIVCHFLGEAHTPDGIVVWIPSEKILFGGNEIRNYNGWVGNIGDANLDKWSETAKYIKQEYGSAKIVVPGHGKYGGPELIDYTIDLFNFPGSESITDNSETIIPNLKTENEFNFESESIQNGKRILKNATVYIQDKSKLIAIYSPLITISQADAKINSETGRVKIYDKRSDSAKLRTDVNYRKLIIYKQDEYNVGFVVILKEIEHNNH
nr:subclass B1 metallo-beta-lactamase, long type [uncultured Draconibacterium sp.]